MGIQKPPLLPTDGSTFAPPPPASTTSRSLDGLFTSANGSMQLRKEDQSSRNRFRLRFRKSMYNWASVD